jgi:DNA polymerase III subunit beta
MKLQVTQENLNKALSVVARVASGRSTLPILSNILFRIEKNSLLVSATNLDIAITHFVGAKIEEEGNITIPARLTQDFIASLPSGTIEINGQDNHLSIKSGKFSSTINGISAEEFPVMPGIVKGKDWKINCKEFKEGLHQIVLAASSDEARPVLTGVYLHTVNGVLFAVATDSYRLAEVKLTNTSQEIELLIPASAVQELLRVLGDEGEVLVSHDDQQALFKTKDIELVTRLIDGQYPDYRKLIPRSFKTKAVLPKAELASITKVSSLFARESAGSITLNIDSKEKLITIHSIASQLGENTASATAEVTGDGSVTLNSRYLLEALGVLQGDEVSFSFNDKLDPIVRKESENSGYTHVIMPLKS